MREREGRERGRERVEGERQIGEREGREKGGEEGERGKEIEEER